MWLFVKISFFDNTFLEEALLSQREEENSLETISYFQVK